MRLEHQVNLLCPVVQGLGYYYLNDEFERAPFVFAKKTSKDLYFFLLIGRWVSDNKTLSVEISLSPSLNPVLKGRDIPSNSIRQLGGLSCPVDMLSNTSSLSECISLAENEMLLDEAMIIALKRSKKMLLEIQLEKWVISWYHSKEVSQLPLISFIQYTPKESTGCIDQKWFVVAEVILRVTWLPIDKDRVYSLAAQSYWKYYLDSV